MIHKLKAVTAFFFVFCFCEQNPVKSNNSDYINYVKFSCNTKKYFIAKEQNGELYSEPKSSYVEFRFGINTSTENNDTALSIGATIYSAASINISFPRQFRPAVYFMKSNNRNPNFRCSYSEGDKLSYFETPHKFNSSDSSSDTIGYLEITRFDFSERVIEGRFQFHKLFKHNINVQNSTATRQNDSLQRIEIDGSFKYHWTGNDIRDSFIPNEPIKLQSVQIPHNFQV